jgi:hypothetical protein
MNSCTDVKRCFEQEKKGKEAWHLGHGIITYTGSIKLYRTCFVVFKAFRLCFVVSKAKKKRSIELLYSGRWFTSDLLGCLFFFSCFPNVCTKLCQNFLLLIVTWNLDSPQSIYFCADKCFPMHAGPSPKKILLLFGHVEAVWS